MVAFSQEAQQRCYSESQGGKKSGLTGDLKQVTYSLHICIPPAGKQASYCYFMGLIWKCTFSTNRYWASLVYQPSSNKKGSLYLHVVLKWEDAHRIHWKESTSAVGEATVGITRSASVSKGPFSGPLLEEHPQLKHWYTECFSAAQC